MILPSSATFFNGLMKLKFWYIDVFSSEKFKGNPAAVFFEADNVSSETMQKIANELNLSETVFLQQPQSSKADYKARIFTPKKELPFAGHPTIAAAFAFKKFYGNSAEKLLQECGAGLIEITQQNSVLTVKQNDPEFGEILLSKKEAALMFGVAESDISSTNFMKIYTGIWWGVFYLASSEAVSCATPNYQKIIELSQKENLVGVQIFAKTNKVPEIHLRTFAPICGVYEDPVCGSGNGCVASYIAKHNILTNSSYTVSQGKEVGREGRVYASFNRDKDIITNIKIGGEAVKVLEGSLEI